MTKVIKVKENLASKCSKGICCLKELRHGFHILKSLAGIFQVRRL